MSALSKLANTFSIIAFLTLAMNVFCEEKNENLDPLERYHSTSNSHGLYDIRKAARIFIENENKNNLIKYQVLEPSLKLQVDLCATQLSARWSITDSPNKTVEVSCPKTVATSYEKKWHVFVPVTPLNAIKN